MFTVLMGDLVEPRRRFIGECSQGKESGCLRPRRLLRLLADQCWQVYFFNRLVGRLTAIVEDIPGVTRDRNYGLASFRGFRFLAIDTGGLSRSLKMVCSSRCVSRLRLLSKKLMLSFF